ncbi:MAG: response regulator [Dissulfurispiraceae bacterium]|nr:response regulator [Dissulfurispiraceae bacterium]
MQRTIYVIDDVPTNVELVEAVFRNDKNLTIKKAYDGKSFLDMLKDEAPPDLVILDLMMPTIDGFGVLEHIKPLREMHYFPVVVLSALTDKQSIIKALVMGADDYITKPFFVEELKVRIYNMLKLKERDEFLNTSLDVMETNLVEKLKMLELTQIEIVIRLGKAAEFRDDETGRHIERIADYVALLAKEVGLNEEQSNMLKYAAPMHDVGKIGIPDGILLKPGKLTDAQFKLIKMHTVIGARILSGTTLPVLELAREIALSHHEKWDGTGYPQGLKGEAIPLSGRIVAICDVFDALTSERVYKHAWSIDQAIEYIKTQRTIQFDPQVVDAFIRIIDKIVKIRTEKADPESSKPLIQQIIDGEINSEAIMDHIR